MTNQPELAVSDAELEVLKVLWEHGPLGVREALAILTNSGQEWSRSTVVTLLRRLEQKRYVTSDKSSYAFIYRPTFSREELMHARVTEVANELSDGEPLPLMLAFAEHHKFTSAELNRLQKMIDELKNRSRRKKPS
jgi:BlaI family penicillinase repressor